MLTCFRLEDLTALGLPLHLALGVFDGVHVGHQAVIARAVEAASLEGGLSGVLTFDPHPIRVIAPEKAPAALLETLEHKSKVIQDLGVKLIIPLHFDQAMARMEPTDFVAQLAAGGVKTIAVGEDWRFGHHRSGDVTFLQSVTERYGFKLKTVPPVMHDGERISSTRIRQALRDGNLSTAAEMLGRPYSVVGTVIEGRKLGRSIGFPTANLSTGDAQLPPNGVWIVKVLRASGERVRGIANLGVRPTVDGGSRLLEIHLVDFAAEIYGETLEVIFERKLRDEVKFSSLLDLRRQIELDLLAARRFWEQA